MCRYELVIENQVNSWSFLVVPIGLSSSEAIGWAFCGISTCIPPGNFAGINLIIRSKLLQTTSTVSELGWTVPGAMENWGASVLMSPGSLHHKDNCRKRMIVYRYTGKPYPYFHVDPRWILSVFQDQVWKMCPLREKFLRKDDVSDFIATFAMSDDSILVCFQALR